MTTDVKTEQDTQGEDRAGKKKSMRARYSEILESTTKPNHLLVHPKNCTNQPSPSLSYSLSSKHRRLYSRLSNLLSASASASFGLSSTASKFSTRSGTSSSSSSSSPPVPAPAPRPAPRPACRCWLCWIAWYDSASLRREARESGPSWLRMPGTSSVSSLTWPMP